VHDVALLVRQFLDDPSRIHFNLGDWHFARRDRHIYGDCHSALVGWGAVFARDWLSVLDLVPEPVRSSQLFQREADQYFTLLQRRHHAAHHAALTNLDGHSTAGLALWRAPEHWRMSSLAVRDALRLVRGSRGFALPPPWHVVVTCRDAARHLAGAVDSVACNDADYELTIVDDASTDDTPQVIGELRSRVPGVRCVRLAEPAGVSRARNLGISASDSAFVVVLDARDRLGGDYLFEASRVLGDGADIANPDALLAGAESGRWSAPPATTLAMLERHNSVHYGAAFRRSWWIELGGFDERAAAADHDFWRRAVARGARVRAVPGDHFHLYREYFPDSSDLQR
jgi:hypothetical protein